MRPFELFILELILFLALWLWDDYIGLLLSVILSGIAFFILIVSLIVEWIEPSKVPRRYFYWIGVTVLAPLLVGVFHRILFGGGEWAF